MAEKTELQAMENRIMAGVSAAIKESEDRLFAEMRAIERRSKFAVSSEIELLSEQQEEISQHTLRVLDAVGATLTLRSLEIRKVTELNLQAMGEVGTDRFDRAMKAARSDFVSDAKKGGWGNLAEVTV